MNIFGFDFKKRYALSYQEKATPCTWVTDSVSKKEDLLPLIEFRKKDFINLKIETEIIISFKRRIKEQI